MDNGKTITLNEAMSWKATLMNRHSELTSLRNQNSARSTSHYGANADKPITTELKYDAIALDQAISRLAMELRKLDLAIKSTNFQTTVMNYVYDEAVMGELQPATK
jgi:hypothetical protein